ncbi:hypothetical protein [Deinococcus sp. Leaf326]|uniref:hypothetical protein n=1 Tax=Deinococcus sp. Leaf326 TaxID=1736338 RepID=UPI000A987157|nr:hypothetical protein [Deinococcus sp. Leaf326]
MYRVTITGRDGTVTMDLTHTLASVALLTFDTAMTFPGKTITLTQDGVELKKRQFSGLDVLTS